MEAFKPKYVNSDYNLYGVHLGSKASIYIVIPWFIGKYNLIIDFYYKICLLHKEICKAKYHKCYVIVIVVTSVYLEVQN